MGLILFAFRYQRSNAPQGLIQTWVDIMPQGDAKAFPADDVALPPALKFEVWFKCLFGIVFRLCCIISI